MASLEDFYSGGPKTTAEAFPPACLRTHWDPTMMVKHILPDFRAPALAYDPRPASKMCTAYYHSSAGDAPAPQVPSPAVGLPPTPPQLLGGPHRPAGPGYVAWPPGGAAEVNFPAKGFAADAESDLLRTSEYLTKCAEKRYIPVGGTPAPATNIVPGSQPLDALIDPMAHAGCREAEDVTAWQRSSRLFFNPTRYDRTIGVPPNLKVAQSQYAARPPYNL